MASTESKKNKKKILVGFDLNIPRQKLAYDILMQEKAETGLASNMIIHEALGLYAAYHAHLRDNISENMKGIGNDIPELTKHRSMAPVAEKVKVQPMESEEEPEEEYLTDDDMTDPSYLVDLLNDAYPDEE